MQGFNAKAIGRRIQHARKAAGLTQRQLAERVGRSRASIQLYESGSVIPFTVMGRMASELNVTARWIQYGSEPEPGSRLEDVLDELRSIDLSLLPPDVAEKIRRLTD